MGNNITKNFNSLYLDLEKQTSYLLWMDRSYHFTFLSKVLNLSPNAIHVSEPKKILSKFLKHSHKFLTVWEEDRGR